MPLRTCLVCPATWDILTLRNEGTFLCRVDSQPRTPKKEAAYSRHSIRLPQIAHQKREGSARRSAIWAAGFAYQSPAVGTKTVADMTCIQPSANTMTQAAATTRHRHGAVGTARSNNANTQYGGRTLATSPSIQSDQTNRRRLVRSFVLDIRKNNALKSAMNVSVSASCEVEAISASDIGKVKTANSQIAEPPAKAMAVAPTKIAARPVSIRDTINVCTTVKSTALPKSMPAMDGR